MIRPEVGLDAFVIMPNHIQGIVVIRDRFRADNTWDVEAHRDAPLHRPPKSLGAIVVGFKGSVTLKVRHLSGETKYIVWQRNYFDRIVRDQRELNLVRRYIRDNPARWETSHRM